MIDNPQWLADEDIYLQEKGGVYKSRDHDIRLSEDIERFEVIDHSSKGLQGRVIVKRDVSVTLSMQDGGKTLKIFIQDKEVSDVCN